MTVRELIEELQYIQNQNSEVLFTYNYGDYWKTTVAAQIEEVSEGTVKHSSYHDMDKVIDEDEDEDEDDQRDARMVVLLK